MRQLTFAVVLASVLGAYAQEGEQIRRRVDIPGEKAVERQLAITPAMMKKWALPEDVREMIRDKLKKLNADRAGLVQQLEETHKHIQAKQKELDGLLAKLREQETALYQEIKPHVADDKRDDFEVMVQLQPLIVWLGLSDSQAKDLVAARKSLLQEFGGQDPATKFARMASEEFDKSKRKEYIDEVKRYLKFNREWLKKVEEVLNENQKRAWNTRFRRTLYTIKEVPGL
jgi:hypothetical protein